MPSQLYKREQNGKRFVLKGGMVTSLPVDSLAVGQYAYLQNVRGYLDDRIMGRATLGDIIDQLAAPVVSVRRLNDTTPLGPTKGYTIVSEDSSGDVYADSIAVATGLTGRPVSIVPFRPNTSVQPWAYIGDSAPDGSVSVAGPDGTLSTPFKCAGMIKVRSDGLSRKWGIKEPQAAPVVTTESDSEPFSGALSASSVPWTNYGGVNITYYNFEQVTQPTPGGSVQPPFIVNLPTGANAVTVAVTGVANVNGQTGVGPETAGPSGAGYPGNFVGAPSIVLGAFTDGAGNVLYSSGSKVPFVVSIGAGGTFTVPNGAVQFQIGINSNDAGFAANSGGFNVSGSVAVSSLSSTPATDGSVTAYVWGDSPHSGPVSTYIWRNPNDIGSGISRVIGTAPVTAVGNSWQIDTTPASIETAPQWDQVGTDGVVVGQVPLYSTPFTDPPNSSSNQSFRDFNACIVGTIFFPTGGPHTLTLTYKDQIMLGIGGGVTAAYQSGVTPASTSPRGAMGQTISVASGLPLVFVSAANGGGSTQTTTLTMQVPDGGGMIQFEIDWVYWYHSGRSMVMEIDGNTIATLDTSDSGTRTNVSYAYVYRASETGATSNPSPFTTPTLTPVLGNVVTPKWSPDPQVDKVDYYRQDSGLSNYTFVGTGPNTNPPTPIIDSASDLQLANNPTLQFDNFEPFPSIDVPKKGIVGVSGGLITWVSGDQFSPRWLPGTLIEIGTPEPLDGTPVVPQLAYSLTSRPTSSVQIVLPGVPDGVNLVYNVAEPKLAGQPMPSCWGPTKDPQYMFACGDPYRPGTLYFTKGNNPDSAPDTNQMEATSPSEPLMNGYTIGGVGVVFSTERAWWIYPNFVSALATVTGVQGNPFTLIESINNRGLYIRDCLCTEGGLNGYFRAKDGIYMSPSGQGSQLISAAIRNLFPQETAEGWSTPVPVTVGPYTIYPPDDTRPEAQKLSFAYGYLYYDYEDVGGTPRTLVWEAKTQSWSVDQYDNPGTVHAPIEGAANGTYVGCQNGAIRALGTSGVESVMSAIVTGADNAGDARAYKRVGDVYVKGKFLNGYPVQVALYTKRATVALAGYGPTSLAGVGDVEPYIIDFDGGQPIDVIDIAAALYWPTSSLNELDLWQPDFISLPEDIQDQASDWTDVGYVGNKLILGLLMDVNTFGQEKTFSAQRDRDYDTSYVPSEAPITTPKQTRVSFSFNPPFVAHLVRRVSTDGIKWQAGPTDGWAFQWLTQKWCEYCTLRSPWFNLNDNRAKYVRGLVLPMDTQGQDATIRVVTSMDDQRNQIDFTANTPYAEKTPVAFAFTPPILAHEIQIQVLTPTAGVWIEDAVWDFDVYPEITKMYTPIMEIGGPDAKFMQGIKVIADSGNEPVTLQVLYDGGQLGPQVTGTWNGKQTLVFSFDTPFTCHDVQLKPLGDIRIWWGGIGDGTSEWVYQPAPEEATTWAGQASSFRSIGYKHAYMIELAYIATDEVTVTMEVDEDGWGGQTLTFPPTKSPTGVFSKIQMKFDPNKWKVMSLKATSPTAFSIWNNGMEVWIGDWDRVGGYRIEKILGGPSSAEGAATV